MFANRVPGKIFGHEMEEITGEWKNCVIRVYIIFASGKMLLKW
jgi:hypothetical protein